jgi:hypothetical protein
LQSAARKLTFQIRGSGRPFCGQAVKNQVLEQHERHPRKGSADYIERGLEFSFIFHWTPENVQWDWCAPGERLKLISD